MRVIDAILDCFDYLSSYLLLVVSVLSIALLVAIIVCAVIYPSAATPPEKLVTIRANNARLGSVLHEIAHDSGLTLETNAIPGDARVTIHVQDARLDPLMADLCTAYNCTWRVENGRLVVRMPTLTPIKPLDRPTSYTPEG